MKVVRTLRVSAEELFAYFESIAEIALEEEHAGEEGYEAPQLAPGVVFRLDADNPYACTTCEVLEFEPGRRYRYHASNTDERLTVSFEVELARKGIQVTYDETLDGAEPGVASAARLGRMSQDLYDIEKRLIDARAGREETDALALNPALWIVDSLMQKRAQRDAKAYRAWSRFRGSRF